MPLPPLHTLTPERFDTPLILKRLNTASRALAELKGVAASIPNQDILISTLTLQEARDSSAIENIVTTQDDLYREEDAADAAGIAVKEVLRYRQSLRTGYEQVRAHGLLTLNTILDIQQQLECNRAGLRKLPGTALRDGAGQLVYEPPQDANDVCRLMSDLEHFIHDEPPFAADPLVKMALIHHQFESIHPFPDGNGRIGRILNVLYLTRAGLLETPILYLSRHITRTKADYYRLLQTVRTQDTWEEWVLYMLEAVAETAQTTLALVEGIRSQMASVKKRMRDELPNLYSQDLLNNLFRYPYTRIEFVVQDLHVSRQTAAKYLDLLADKGFVAKHRSGRSNYYVNTDLVRLFLDVSGER